MPDPVTGLIAGGATLIGGSMQSSAARSAAGAAAGAQTTSAESAIAEQRRQFDQIQKLLAPYTGAGQSAIGRLSPFESAGTGAIPGLQRLGAAGLGQIDTLQGAARLVPQALSQQAALAGLGGAASQRQAIGMVEQSPQMQALVQQGENALLQNASATGGLRGGNIQAALAQFRPQMLAGLIDQQYARLGGLTSTGIGAASELFGVGGQTLGNLAESGRLTTSDIARLGQAAASGQAAQGASTAANIGNLMSNVGAAQAGAALAGGTSPFGQFASAIPGMIGTYYGATGGSPFGGGAAAPASSIYSIAPAGGAGGMGLRF
jgi:hypothetical protein